MMNNIFYKIRATIALCLVAVSCVGCISSDVAALELVEKRIRLQWQKNPKLSYHLLSYKGTLQECRSGSKHFYKQNVLTMQGKWIPVHELPARTLVFRGEVEKFKPGKTLGGAGYFFCFPKTGELVAYLLMK